MSLIRWNPYRNFVSLPQGIVRLFNELTNDFLNTNTVWQPSLDITESDDNYEVKAEIPGMKKDDIKISFQDDVLMLTGEKKHEKEEKGKEYHRIERNYGKFERSLRFPNHIKTDAIKANYKNGVLTVSIPKSEQAKLKEIAIG